MDRFTKLKDKKTENEANLPDGWKRVRLGEILSFRNGKSPQIVDGGMYPIYGSNGLIGFTNDYFLNGVFLLVGRVGASGETHLVSGKVWASDNCLIGECKSDTTPVFIYYLLKYLDLKKFITQTAQPLITQSFVNNLQIILPPLPEQRKIAEILETVDNAIEKTDAIIEKYKRIKQGLMQDLLTRGIAESDELGVMSYELRDEKKHRFKDSPLGRIPEEWEVVELGEIGSIRSGSTPDTSKPEFWNGNIVWITPDDLSKLEGKYIYTSSRKITKKGLQNCSAKIIPKNSVVISSRAPIGYLAISKVDITTNQGCKSVVLNKLFEIEFIYYCLFQYIDKMIMLGSGTTFSEISKTELSKLKIAVPIAKSEQKRIAKILSQIDEALEKEQKYKEKLERIKRGLMEDLLTGKVRVLGVMNYELGVRS